MLTNEPNRRDGIGQAHRGGRIDLNHASVDDLLAIGGISKGTAEDVIRFRDEHGGIRSWADFNSIRIVGEEAEKLRPHVGF